MKEKAQIRQQQQPLPLQLLQRVMLVWTPSRQVCDKIQFLSSVKNCCLVMVVAVGGANQGKDLTSVEVFSECGLPLPHCSLPPLPQPRHITLSFTTFNIPCHPGLTLPWTAWQPAEAAGMETRTGTTASCCQEGSGDSGTTHSGKDLSLFDPLSHDAAFH